MTVATRRSWESRKETRESRARSGVNPFSQKASKILTLTELTAAVETIRAAQPRDVGLAQRVPGVEDGLKPRLIAPPRLIHGPRGHAGLRQRLHTLGFVALSGFPQLRGQCIAIGRELIDLIETVDGGVDVAR